MTAIGLEQSMISRAEAIARANAHLRREVSPWVAHEDSALPNPRQSLWIVGYRDPQHPDVVLDGGGLVVVPSTGPVYEISSVPGQPELIGVEVPEDLKDAPLPDDWADLLSGEYDKAYWTDLMTFVGSERREYEVYPPPSRTFAAFELTRYIDTRVVIVGQDPYHRPGQAHGLSFSVPMGVRKPRSLINIYKELASDLGIDPPSHGSLEGWARQGVLLLNTTLTVRRWEPGSHRGKGWEKFTDEVIRAVNETPDRVVFLLWGGHAQKKKPHIDTARHAVIESAHPTARGNARHPFLESGPFSQTNQLLQEAGRPPIVWAQLTSPSEC